MLLKCTIEQILNSCVVFLGAKAISGSGTHILAPGTVMQYSKAISKPISSPSKIAKIERSFLHRPCRCFQEIWRLSWTILMDPRQARLCRRLVGSILKPFRQQLSLSGQGMNELNSIISLVLINLLWISGTTNSSIFSINTSTHLKHPHLGLHIMRFAWCSGKPIKIQQKVSTVTF